MLDRKYERREKPEDGGDAKNEKAGERFGKLVVDIGKCFRSFKFSRRSTIKAVKISASCVTSVTILKRHRWLIVLFKFATDRGSGVKIHFLR